jgi:hypothetical protein
MLIRKRHRRFLKTYPACEKFSKKGIYLYESAAVAEFLVAFFCASGGSADRFTPLDKNKSFKILLIYLYAMTSIHIIEIK